METLSECLICSSKNSSGFLKCVDQLVSKNEFMIVQCTGCGFKYTNPRPNADEIGKYYSSNEYISHSSTSQGLISKIYLLVRNYTLIKKRKLIDSFAKKRGRILDIGCGTGDFLNTCKKAGWEVTGIEPTIDARTIAIEKYGLKIYDNVTSLKEDVRQFDIITMWHVLEHVHDLNETIGLLKQLLKPQGTLIIALPNSNSWDARHYQQFWAAYDVPRHLYHFKPSDVKTLFRKYRMKVERILPMWFDAFYIAMLSEKHKHGKTNYLRAMYNGLKYNLKAMKDGETFSSQIYVVKFS